MSTATSRPLSLWRIDFADLFARHLCRHSQFGINVAHLAALFGIWYAVYAIVYWLVANEWVLIAMGVCYLLCMVANLPLRITLATTAFVAVLITTVVVTAMVPIWVFPLLIPACYKLQSYSHKVYTVERDMTEFNLRYPKGKILFVILLFYEVPIVLNYLMVGDKERSALTN